MNTHQIHAVVILAEELHFHRAAKKLHLSQPALSLKIKKLEEELGIQLFERSAHQVRLTAAGEKFIPELSAILGQLDRKVSELQETSTEAQGVLRVAAIPTIGPYLLPLILPQLRKKAPNLKLELFEETTSLLLTNVKKGNYDLGVISPPISQDGLAVKILGREDFLLAVSQKHPFTKKKKISLEELKSEKLLILQEGHCFGEQMLSYCEHSRQDSRIVFQGSSLASVMKLAAVGEGVTLVPAMSADKEYHRSLSFIPFSGTRPQRDLGVVWRFSSRLTKAHKLVMDLIEEAFKVL